MLTSRARETQNVNVLLVDKVVPKAAVVLVAKKPLALIANPRVPVYQI